MTFNEIISNIKDIILFLAGSGIFAKFAVEWINYQREKKKIKNKEGHEIFIHNESGGNGKVQYATIKDLMEHALECPKNIYEKIEDINTRLSEKMDSNHRETMRTFTQIKMAIKDLQLKINK